MLLDEIYLFKRSSEYVSCLCKGFKIWHIQMRDGQASIEGDGISVISFESGHMCPSDTAGTFVQADCRSGADLIVGSWKLWVDEKHESVKENGLFRFHTYHA